MKVLRFVWFLLAMVVASVAFGQEPPQLRLSNPQEAFLSFREVLQEVGASEAVAALDLSGVSDQIQPAERFEIARKLGEVLDSDTWETSEIPIETEENRVVLRTYMRADTDETLGQIALMRGEDGFWRFASSTVSAVPELWQVRVEPNLIPSEPSGSGGSGDDGEAGEDPPEDVPDALANPRATMSTFLDAMNAEPIDFPTAVSTLDLSNESALIADDEGRDYALRIFGILNRTILIDLDDIPDDPSGDSYVIPIEVTQGSTKNLLGEFSIARKNDGRWLFTADTLAQIDEIWLEVADLETISGLRDIQPFEDTVARWARQNLSEGWLAPPLFGLEPWQWLAIPLACIVSYLIGLAARIIVKLYIAMRGNFDGLLNKEFIERAGKGVSLLVNSSLLKVFTLQLGLSKDWKAILFFVVEVVQAVAFIWVGMAILTLIVEILRRKNRVDKGRVEKLVIPLVRNFGRVIIVTIAVVYLLYRVGFDVRSLIAGLGLGGLVFALAAKDSVENLFGSFTVLFEMPFQIGDWVIVDDIEGNVEKITIRSTRIRTFADSLILIPNSAFISSPVENMGRRRYRRIKTTIGITYDTPPEKMEKFLEEIRTMVKEHPHTWKQKMHIYFNDFGSSSLDILLYIFVEAPDWGKELALREDILLRIVRIANGLGVEFAFPTQMTILDSKNQPGPVEVKVMKE